MDDAIHETLARWGDFYLITGTAAAALTGLQFVAQTLSATNTRRVVTGDPERVIAAFGSPTVVHFSLALIVSATVCAPWPGFEGLRAALAMLGAGALGYSGIVLRRARRQHVYAPVAEDWVWHFVLPEAAYAILLVAALRLRPAASGPLFAIAAATLLLLCVGIHNAWDYVAYVTVRELRAGAPTGEPAPPRRDEAHGERP